MTTTRTILTAIAACVMLCATAQTYDLKLDLKKGLKYEQAMVMNITMDEAIAGQQITVDMTANFGFTQEVQAVEANGDYVIECTYSHVSVSATALGHSITYDSDLKKQKDSIAESMGQSFAPIMGKKFILTMSPKGKVSKVTGLKELLTEVAAHSSPGSMQLAQAFFDENKILSNYSSSYGCYPDHPVAVGDTWSGTNKVSSIVPMEIATTYTLKEMKGNNAVVTMTADMSMHNDSMEVQGMTAKIDLKGTSTGHYKIDMKTGLPTSGTIEMPISGSMEVMNMSVPMNLRSSLDMRCKIR